MNFQDAVSILAPEQSKWTRLDRLNAICVSIQGGGWDLLETREILGVLIGSLKYRFDESELGDIQHETNQLIEALEEYQYELSLKERGA